MSISKALYNLAPEATWSISGEETIANIDWQDDSIDMPSAAAITAEAERLQAEYDAQQYARDRAVAYPSLQDQADMQYWDVVNGTTTWQDAIAAVKAEFPKP